MTLHTESGVSVAVPDNTFADDVPLVAVMRGRYVGSLHRGSFVAVDVDGRPVMGGGNTSEKVFLRSAAKPFQVIPALLSGGLDRFGITERELAVLCASHSGEPQHMEAVLSVLARIGLDESALQCGVHPPIHALTAQKRWRRGQEPTPVCNNCSGAHAGMLVACVANGWSTDGYGSPHHPLQVQTREILSAFTHVPADQIEFGVDNCHVPAFRFSLKDAAMAFARLATGQRVSAELVEAARRVRAAMTAYPEMVGGEERFDSDLMRAAGGDVVAKGGAEGFQGVGMAQLATGFAIKISDGASRAIAPVAVPVLHHLGALNLDACQELSVHSRPLVLDLQGEVVGNLEPVFSFEGDR